MAFVDSSEDDFSDGFIGRSPTELSSDDEEPFDYEDIDNEENDKTIQELNTLIEKQLKIEIQENTKSTIEDIELINSFTRSIISKNPKCLIYLLKCLIEPHDFVKVMNIAFEKSGPIQKMISIDKKILLAKSKKIVFDESIYSQLLEQRSKCIDELKEQILDKPLSVEIPFDLDK